MSDLYAAIDQIVRQDGFAASAVCDLVEVSRSGFYAWRSSAESLREAEDRELIPLIGDVFWRHRRRYGARRVCVELSRRGIACGVVRVARLMRSLGFRATQPKSCRSKTTESRHRLGYSTNLLLGRSAPEKVNEVSVDDITYIPLATRTTEGRFGYLALLMDLFSRKIVGWEYSSTMTDELVLGALHQAIRARQPGMGLIHHTDRGGQCASRRYREVLRRSGIRQSMGTASSCYDNAFAESSFGTIKTELELVEYANGSEAARELSSYIRYYNGDRQHSSLGYVAPAEFERNLAIAK